MMILYFVFGCDAIATGLRFSVVDRWVHHDVYRVEFSILIVSVIQGKIFVGREPKDPTCAIIVTNSSNYVDIHQHKQKMT